MKIDKGVSIPTEPTVRNVFQTMEIGDSFAVEPEEYRRIRSRSEYWSKALKRTFQWKKMPNEQGKYRCWRLT